MRGQHIKLLVSVNSSFLWFPLSTTELIMIIQLLDCGIEFLVNSSFPKKTDTIPQIP